MAAPADPCDNAPSLPWLAGIGDIDVVSLPDLVQIKKTQRDEDWPMVRRLIEADVARSEQRPPLTRVRFWLRECRTYPVLRELALRFPDAARSVAGTRPALKAAIRGDEGRSAAELRREEDRERRRDQRYWAPLRRELERLRLGRERAC